MWDTFVLPLVVAVVGAVVAALAAWGLRMLREIRGDVHGLTTAVVGLNGQGGLISEVLRLRDWRHSVAQVIASDHTAVETLQAELETLERTLTELRAKLKPQR